MIGIGKQKKIIFFANTLWFLWNFKSELAKEFIVNGFEVDFVFLNDGYFSKGEKNEALVKLKKNKVRIYNVRKYNLNDKNYNVLLSYTLKCILYSPFLFNKCNLKIANYDGLGRIFSSRLIYVRLAKRILEKIYFILHNFFYQHTVVLNSSDYIYFLNKNINKPSNISILPGTGINKEYFKFNPRYEIDFKKHYITMISRLNNLKGINNFLALVYITNFIFKDNFEESIKFRIVLPPKDLTKLKKLISENKIIKNNLLIESYSIDVKKIYDSSLCLVHPTIYGEGLPRVYLESAACGVPVITTKNPGYVDFYTDNRTALIVEKNNPKQILDKIEELINNHNLRKKIIDNSKKNLDRFFSSTNEQYLEIVNKLLDL